MAMGTQERIAREIENYFERLKSKGKIPGDMRLVVQFEESQDPDFLWQGVAYNAQTRHRIAEIPPIFFELREVARLNAR